MATINVGTSQNLSGVSYAAGDIINIINGATLVIDSTPSIRPGQIQCLTSGKLSLQNGSTATPIVLTLDKMTDDLRFEGNGALEALGDMIDLGTGTGATQSFDFTTLYSGIIKDLTYVEVETASGSGVYRPWPIIEIDPIYYGLGRTAGGGAQSLVAGSGEVSEVFFWHNGTRILSTGNGTNGSPVVSGAKIRIPNIFVTNNVALDSTLIHALVSEGVPTGGTFTITVINRATGATLGTTSAIAFNAAAATIDTAIEAITGAGTITSAGGPLPTAVSLTLAGAFATTPLAFVVTNSLTGGTNPAIYTRENSAANLSLVDVNPSGAADLSCVSFSRKFRLNNSSFSSFRAVRCGFGGDGLVLSSSNGDVELDHVHQMSSPFCVEAASGASSVLGSVSIKKFVVTQRYAQNALNVSVVPGLTALEDLKLYSFGNRGTTAATGINIATVTPNIPILRPVSIGARMVFTNLVGNPIVAPKYADGPGSAQITTNAMSAIQLANCVNNVVSGFALAGAMAPRNYLFLPDINTFNLSLIGSTVDAGNNTLGVVQPNGKITNIQNYNVSNIRTGPTIDQPAAYTATNIIAKKVLNTFATAQSVSGLDVGQDSQYDLVSSSVAGITETFVSVENYVGGNFADPGLTPTTGHLTIGPIGKGLGLVMTGSAYTNQTGDIFLPTAGDTAEITMPFAVHGITSFQNVTPSLYADLDGGKANVHFVISPGVPTGGTFTLTVANAAGTVLGTTSALAFNAAAATVDSALEAIAGVGVGQITLAGTAIGTGYTITFTGTLANIPMIVTVNGASLTGGTTPGVAYAYGRARQILNETFGAGLTCEFACRVPGTSWPAYQTLNATNVSGAIAALVGYGAGTSGLEIRFLLTAVNTNPYNSLRMLSLLTNINPSLWTVSDSTITLNGPAVDDTIDVVRSSDDVVLYTFTGSGLKSFDVGANYGTPVYFIRREQGGNVLMSTILNPVSLTIGSNGIANLFYGAEVQLAQSSKVDLYLDAAISSRLATLGYTAPPTAVDIRTEIDTNSTKLDVAVSTRLATAGYTAPNNADISAIKAKTDNLPVDPADESSIQAAIAAIPVAPSASTVATAVRSELTTELARVDVAISTREAESAAATRASANQTEHDSTQSAIAAIPSAPSAATVASSVRTELTTELNRIDVAVSTRNATAPLDSTATQAAAAAALNAYDAPTKTEFDAGVASITKNTNLIPGAL